MGELREFIVSCMGQDDIGEFVVTCLASSVLMSYFAIYFIVRKLKEIQVENKEHDTEFVVKKKLRKSELFKLLISDVITLIISLTVLICSILLIRTWSNSMLKFIALMGGISAVIFIILVLAHYVMKEPDSL